MKGHAGDAALRLLDAGRPGARPIDVEYGAIDVLPALQPLREVTAEISDWQTFPQLYVNGELLGGADIVEEMFESGELAEALGVEQPEAAAAAAPRAPAQSPPLQIE